MHFIVCDPTWAGATGGFPIDKVEFRSAATLLSLLLSCQNSAIVFLHYVGHGYKEVVHLGWSKA